MGWAKHQQGPTLLLPSKQEHRIGPKSNPAVVRSDGDRNVKSGQMMVMLNNLLGKEKQMIKCKSPKGPSDLKGTEALNDEKDMVVQWLYTVHHDFSQQPETFVLATSILNTFLYAVKVKEKYLKCIAITSLLLACKITEEEEEQPTCQELIEKSGCGFTKSDVLRMERLILDKLQWNINLPTSVDFLQLFHAMVVSSGQICLSAMKVTASKQLSILTRKLEYSLCYSPLASCYPSTLALAILSLELEQFSPEWLKATCLLQRLISLENQQLIRCREICTRYMSSLPGLDTHYLYYQHFMGRSPTSTPTPTPSPLSPISPNAGSGFPCCPPSKYSSYSAAVIGNKRKVEETGKIEDIYDGIKKLYS